MYHNISLTRRTHALIRKQIYIRKSSISRLNMCLISIYRVSIAQWLVLVWCVKTLRFESQLRLDFLPPITNVQCLTLFDELNCTSCLFTFFSAFSHGTVTARSNLSQNSSGYIGYHHAPIKNDHLVTLKEGFLISLILTKHDLQ